MPVGLVSQGLDVGLAPDRDEGRGATVSIEPILWYNTYFALHGEVLKQHLRNQDRRRPAHRRRVEQGRAEQRRALHILANLIEKKALFATLLGQFVEFVYQFQIFGTMYTVLQYIEDEVANSVQASNFA